MAPCNHNGRVAFRVDNYQPGEYRTEPQKPSVHSTDCAAGAKLDQRRGHHPAAGGAQGGLRFPTPMEQACESYDRFKNMNDTFYGDPITHTLSVDGPKSRFERKPDGPVLGQVLPSTGPPVKVWDTDYLRGYFTTWWTYQVRQAQWTTDARHWLLVLRHARCD